MEKEKKNTLLIVDDEAMNLKILSNILLSEYTVLTAKSGEEAIEKAREYRPDLILLDIIMPGMDGYETLVEIKKCETIKNTPVIIITGLNSIEDEEKGLSLNAVDYITKPFSNIVVRIRVKNQIEIINQMRTIELLSLTDKLTTLPNRRCFDDRLNLEWKLAIRERTQLSLLMIDIDKFKIVNDTFGHQHGDVVLQTIANILNRSFRRPGDFSARWGGEEFVVLLPRTIMEGALEIAENLRAEVENEVILCESGSTMKVTVSVGVNSLIPEQNTTINAFISNADKALYAAKDAGRNKVIPYC